MVPAGAETAARASNPAARQHRRMSDPPRKERVGAWRDRTAPGSKPARGQMTWGEGRGVSPPVKWSDLAQVGVLRGAGVWDGPTWLRSGFFAEAAWATPAYSSRRAARLPDNL